MYNPTYKEIEKYVDEGFVTVREHPENPDIVICNYTPACQCSKLWNEVTLRCRGLIMNRKTNAIISNPFPKFFNYDEHISLGYNIPEETPNVHQKMDGSLGILYFLDGEPWIATRGSFTSDQAIWATKYYREHYRDAVTEQEAKEWTYLFEIIYPENRIVLQYDYSGLVLLSMRSVVTDNEIIPTEHTVFMLPMRHRFKSIDYHKAENTDNEEGYILHYPYANVRVKIKFAEYVRLHKIITGLSEKGIWEMLREHGISTNATDLVKDVPDEFFEWMDTVIQRLRTNYKTIQFDAASAVAGANAITERREQATYIQRTTLYPGVAFQMLDDKQYAESIFKLIKPKAISKEE